MIAGPVRRLGLLLIAALAAVALAGCETGRIEGDTLSGGYMAVGGAVSF